MKSLLSKRVLILFIIILGVIHMTASANSLYPKDDSEKIEQMVNKLEKKLLLNDEQSAAITGILKEYFRKVAGVAGNSSKISSLKESASGKISALLDRKQRMKFEIIETDWWAIANE